MSNRAVVSMVVALLAAVFVGSVGAPPASATRNATAPPPFGANHTVGEGAGWFFDGKANASAVDYSAWTANRSFYLGDYLGFNTNTGNTVVHTTNATVYNLCGGGGGGATAGCGGWKPEEAYLAVMLTAEGANYFFSDAGGGEHCRKGMRFEVAVARGRGLPPVPPSYYEPLSGAPPGGRPCGGVVLTWIVVGVAFAELFLL